MGSYKRLSLSERITIEESLNSTLSFSRIAKMLNRSVSSVAWEVKRNRETMSAKAPKVACRDQNACVKTGICKSCVTPGESCVKCRTVLCKTVCSEYLSLASCPKLMSAPWVCNGCKRLKGGYSCTRSGRYIYRAQTADKSARDIRSSSRIGVNMTRERFEYLIGIIYDAVKRGMSPYEITASYSDYLRLSASTIYRWVERGYGGIANIDLERKPRL